MTSLMQDPGRFAALQSGYLAKQAQLWSAMLGRESGPLVQPEPGDRRFSASEWRDNPYYAYVKQSYLLASRFLGELAENAQLDAKSRERLQFAVKQWCDAMCPANFAATNPAVLKQALASSGESIARGIANLIGDTHRGRISQSDESAFEVGGNLALTPGDVVYENELIQLIQYRAVQDAPLGAAHQVGVRPLVIVPPCINNYYILDLRPDNSFVRYAVE